ncbi:MAG: ATPase domain-containing protein [Candidatus Hydrothermarchaeota archaeon]
MIERVPFGIRGLDDMLEGGIPRGRTVLITGTTGTGKSILAAQFLYNGVTEYNEPGILVTLEERPYFIRQNLLRFNWHFQKLEDDGKLAIIDASATRIGLPSDERHVQIRPFDLDSLMDGIQDLVYRYNARRVAIDSVTALGLQFEDEFTIRREILRLCSLLENLNCTTLLVTEIEEGSKQLSKFGVEEYVTHGTILLELDSKTGKRHLTIKKMRGTNHPTSRNQFTINENGISIGSRH